MNKIHVTVTALLTLAIVATIATVATAAPKSPNIVFVLADDLGWTDLACYGSDLYETPNLDRLAKQGVRFTDAYASAPLCSATRAAILTGWAPARQHLHGVTPHKRTESYGNSFADYESWDVTPKLRSAKAMKTEIPVQLGQLPLSRVTIAERLKEAGYATGYFGKWHLGPDDNKYAEKQGFDVNLGGTNYGWPPSYFSPYHIPNLPDGPKREYITDRLTVEACAFIEKSVKEKKPFFCYLAHFAVHGPWQGKPEYVEYFKKKIHPGMTHRNAQYAAIVKSLDDSVGQLMKQLNDLGIEDKTLLIFASDNGGVNLTKPQTPGTVDGFVTSNAPLRGFKCTTRDGGLRIPQIVRWPGVTEAGTVSSEPVVSTDFYPTLLAVAGLTPLPDNPLDGIDLIPILQGKPSRRTQLTWFMPHYMALGSPDEMPSCGVIREGDWKLIKLFQGGFRLFNLKNDIGETKNLANTMPEKTAQLEKKLMAELKQQNAFIPAINPDFDKQVFETYRTQMRKQNFGN